MLRFILPVMLAIAVTACAGSPGPVEPPKAISAAQGGETATVIINRVNAQPLHWVDANIMLNGKAIGTISNGQCVRATIPVGDHFMQLTQGLLGNIGGALGNAVAGAFKFKNVKIKSGQTLHYAAMPYYDGPNTGWLFRIQREASGRVC